MHCDTRRIHSQCAKQVKSAPTYFLYNYHTSCSLQRYKLLNLIFCFVVEFEYEIYHRNLHCSIMSIGKMYLKNYIMKDNCHFVILIIFCL